MVNKSREGKDVKENVVFVSPDIICIKLVGEPSPGEMQEVVDELDRLSKGVDGPKILTDISELKNIPPGTRKIVSKEGSWPSYDKIAVIGASARLRVLASLMLKLIPYIKKSKFFDNETEARAWLAEK